MGNIQRLASWVSAGQDAKLPFLSILLCLPVLKAVTGWPIRNALIQCGVLLFFEELPGFS